jgi:N-succinyldiaminopimelate aminotransferase
LSRDDLALIAELCIAHDVTVISDEVYEHLLYDDAVHVPIATLPGMSERTVTIGSAGKSFGMTGWKVGWVYGPADLVGGVARAHQFVAFAVNHPAQIAVAEAFAMPGGFFEEYRESYTRKRDLIMQGIAGAGLKARAPQGTYFVMADFSEVFDGDDVAFARRMIEKAGVAVIPPTFFFSEGNKALGRTQTRFSFAKHDETLERAAERMAGLAAKL